MPLLPRVEILSILEKQHLAYIKQLHNEEHGQGLTEYALILGLVRLGFWMAIKNTKLGPSLGNIFNKVKGNVDNCC